MQTTVLLSSASAHLSALLMAAVARWQADGLEGAAEFEGFDGRP